MNVVVQIPGKTLGVCVKKYRDAKKNLMFFSQENGKAFLEGITESDLLSLAK